MRYLGEKMTRFVDELYGTEYKEVVEKIREKLEAYYTDVEKKPTKLVLKTWYSQATGIPKGYIVNRRTNDLYSISTSYTFNDIEKLLLPEEVKTKPKSAYDKQSLKAPKEWWVYEDRLFRASFHTEKDAIEFVKLHRASGCNYTINHQPLDKSPYFSSKK